MTSAAYLRMTLLATEVNERFTAASLQFSDRSRLEFRHTVAERWAKATGAGQCADETGIAGQLLSAMTMFRLNAKHLDIQFMDGSRWDESLQKPS